MGKPIINGVILIDKPIDWTSFDVVNFIRAKLSSHSNLAPKKIKVGHAGTLDPFASGLLIVLIGQQFTKQADLYLKLDKCYQTTLKLGQISSTIDPTGKIENISQQVPTLSQINHACQSFKGEIVQAPPIFSAIKVNGQPAYKLARAGQTVELKKRLIKVKALDIISYSYPYLKLKLSVSSGTYIRSICQDLGQLLECGAYCHELRRLSIGPYKVDKALSPKAIDFNLFNSYLIK